MAFQYDSQAIFAIFQSHSLTATAIFCSSSLEKPEMRQKIPKRSMFESRYSEVPTKALGSTRLHVRKEKFIPMK
jgi:hypothetical protein